MKFLATYILRGQKEAVIVTAVTALLSLIFFPLSYLSAATVGLVTLHIGRRQGLIVAIISAAVMALLAQLLVGSYLPAIVYLLLLWAPVWWIANRLRNAKRLSSGMLQSALFGLLLIGGFYLLIDHPAAWWQRLLDESLQIIFADGGALDPGQLATMIEQLANFMTGMMAVGFMLHLLGSLFLARWWQAMLSNPGGFGREFRDIRLGRVAAGGTLGLLIVALAMGSAQGMLLIELLMVMALLFMLQGIALVHALVYNRKAHQGWLIGLYILLAAAMPQMVMTLTLAGLADNWFNFRAFWPLKGSTNDPEEGSE